VRNQGGWQGLSANVFIFSGLAFDEGPLAL
jgi:hypothetical protein